ncbi:hypothetical protein [Paenibacillus sp. MMO-58]|uniref:hypothetical protein n=1 Tax=Paenibacillus sp. MMO-58 TaxID=3081290 RepID=UPI003019AAD1
MKKLQIDFNEPDPFRFRITEYEIHFFNSNLGEVITFYTENLEVRALVELDAEKKQWFGKHIEEIRAVSTDIEEAREDGFNNGHHFGIWTTKDNIVRKMNQLNQSEDLIHLVTGVSVERIRSLR